MYYFFLKYPRNLSLHSFINSLSKVYTKKKGSSFLFRTMYLFIFQLRFTRHDCKTHHLIHFVNYEIFKKKELHSKMLYKDVFNVVILEIRMSLFLKYTQDSVEVSPLRVKHNGCSIYIV